MSTQSRYNDFDRFMYDALRKACGDPASLKRAYQMRDEAVFQHHLRILRMRGGGFWVLVAIAVAWAAGVVAFPAAVAALIATPPGWVILAVFGVASTYILLRIFRERRALRGVVEVGTRLKARHAALVAAGAPTAEFDSLFREAVVALLVTPERYYGEKWRLEQTDLEWNARWPCSRPGSEYLHPR